MSSEATSAWQLVWVAKYLLQAGPLLSLGFAVNATQLLNKWLVLTADRECQEQR